MTVTAPQLTDLFRGKKIYPFHSPHPDTYSVSCNIYIYILYICCIKNISVCPLYGPSLLLNQWIPIHIRAGKNSNGRGPPWVTSPAFGQQRDQE